MLSKNQGWHSTTSTDAPEARKHCAGAALVLVLVLSGLVSTSTSARQVPVPALVPTRPKAAKHCASAALVLVLVLSGLVSTSTSALQVPGLALVPKRSKAASESAASKAS